MHIRSLQRKKICILGFGREGESTLRALQKYAPRTDITVADRNEETSARCQVLGVRFQVGPEYLNNLHHFDVVIKSPGIPPSLLPLYNLKPKTYHLVSATQIFFDTIADTGATVIGVTGSKGKSTTVSLIFEILKTAGKNVHLIGNIGNPSLDYLKFAKTGTIFVMEMSSYQLMNLTVSPHIAVITSFFPEHLDYHGSLEAYKEAKRNICRFQQKTDVVFYGEGADAIAMLSPGKKIPYSEKDAPVKIDETRLIGQHNLHNIAAAWKVAENRGIPRTIAIQAIREFLPLPHRLQSLGIHHGIEWIDDAISTTPESTIAALDAIGSRVTTIILGGLDRGYDFTNLAQRIACSSIKNVILLVPSNVEVFQDSGPSIREALKKTKVNVTPIDAHSMEEAVEFAKINSQFSIVLLSPASPSYNMFKNFEEKGDAFRLCITTNTVSHTVL